MVNRKVSMLKRVLLSAILVLIGLLMVVASAVDEAAAQGVVDSPEVVEVMEKAKQGGDGPIAKENTAPAPVGGRQVESGQETEESEGGAGEGGVDYYLPYPGILPDHPLYVVKMVRDKVRLVLTRSKPDKAELMLLFADKRVGASAVLVRGGKDSLGVETALKAEKYLFETSDLLSSVDDASLWEKLGKARQKHEEVLAGLRDQLEDEDRNVLESALEINGQVKERVVNGGGQINGEKDGGLESPQASPSGGEPLRVTM